ncbi:uncharacterized protein LOC107221751 [Neodiprion lecontei]|uniref:Uncharacterized protein LOC107221751 n=1 Tax=Neodiprion lecontei TaxID=441921 RepID=A0A6J0BP61_NEOLC|nr:uncharacterized protein LOC107221751 [Neodiprion lecontei]
MFRITFAACFAIVALAIVSAEELYSDIHDDIDVMGILQNPAVRKTYYDCFMDLGPCVTEDAKFFKAHFPDAVASHCRRCTVKQREHFDTVAVWYTENEPEEWKTLIAKGIADAHGGKIISTLSTMLRITFLVGFAVAVLGMIAAEELYPDKYDDVNATEILQNDRLRNQYYKCFIGSGPCITADAVFFKGFFPEAVLTKCRKCTEKQKKTLDILVDWYAKNQPEQWNALVAKFLEDVQKNKN